MNKSHPFSIKCVERNDFYDEDKYFYVDFKNEEESVFLFTMDLSDDESLILDRVSTGDIRIGDVFFDKRTSDFYIFSFHFFGNREYPRNFGFKNLEIKTDLILIGDFAKDPVRFSYIGNIFQSNHISLMISATCPKSKNYNYNNMIDYYKEINSNIQITSNTYYQSNISLFETMKSLYESERNNEVWDIYFDVKDIKNIYDDLIFINDYLKTGCLLTYNEEFFNGFINKKSKRHYLVGYNSLNKKEKNNFEILKYLVFYFDRSGIVKYKSLHNGKEYTINELIRMNPRPFMHDNYYEYHHLCFDKDDYIKSFLNHI